MKQYRIKEIQGAFTPQFIPQISQDGGLSWTDLSTGLVVFNTIDSARQFIDKHNKDSNEKIHEYSPGTSNKQILND